eukprot:TRINITY_DN1413_c0_g3_i1.p1 TRINITY_DN1413_c0_g3~~TRINITY_DN1413_c0_g3_i1.p1  ORF type:complete len:635 (-),score=102.79 TRINITY_DN1413_c0_g3_i1:37-1941(-)
MSSITLSSAPRYPNSLVPTPYSPLTVITDHSVYFFPMNASNPSNYSEMISIHKERAYYQVGQEGRKVPLRGFPLTSYTDRAHYFRSGSWSPPIYSFGSLFAICSTDRKVSTFRATEFTGSLFRRKWEELDVVSDQLYNYYLSNNFCEGGACDFEKATTIQEVNRNGMLATNSVAWSPGIKGKEGYYSILALGGVTSISFWKQTETGGKIIGVVKEGVTQITCMAWTSQRNEVNSIEDCILATGSSDGSVNLWKLSDTGANFRAANICSIFGQDLISVWCLSWSHSKDVLYISKNGGIASYTTHNNSLLYNPSVHTHPITSFILNTHSPLLYTASTKGSIKVLDSQTLKIVSDLEQFSLSSRSNGIFGMAISPYSLYLTVIEQVKGSADTMYQSRHATTKFSFININRNFDAALNKLEEYKFFNPWDIFKSLKSDIELGQMREMVDKFTKLRKSSSSIKPLQVLFAILSLMLAKPSLESELQDYLRTTAKKIEKEIMLSFIEKALTKLQSKGAVSPIEISSVSLFCEWISNYSDEPALIELRKKTQEKFKETVHSCMICNEPITLINDFCPNGHPLCRCSRTFLLLDSPWIFHCDSCGKRYRKFKKDTNEFDWIGDDCCVFCNTSLSDFNEGVFS